MPDADQKSGVDAVEDPRHMCQGELHVQIPRRCRGRRRDSSRICRGRVQRPPDGLAVRGGIHVSDMGYNGRQAERTAEQAAARWGEDKLTEAIGEGLGAIAYALLEVATAIRENTEARR